MTREVHDALESAIRIDCESGNFRSAAEVAIRGYGPEILGYLVGMLPKREADGHDLFQQWCLVVVEKLAGFRWQSSFRTWAYAVAQNLLRAFVRSGPNRASRRHDLDDPHLSALVDQVRTRTAPYLRTDVKDRLRALRAELNPEDQALLILRIDRGLAWADIATILAEEGKPVQVPTLRKRMSRIRTRLHELAVAAGLLDEA